MKTIQRSSVSGEVEFLDIPLDEYSFAYVLLEELTVHDKVLAKACEYAYNRMSHTAGHRDPRDCRVEKEGFIAFCARDGISIEDAENAWRQFCKPFTS